MRAGQYANPDIDGSHGTCIAPVYARLTFENAFAHDALLDLLNGALKLRFSLVASVIAC